MKHILCFKTIVPRYVFTSFCRVFLRSVTRKLELVLRYRYNHDTSPTPGAAATAAGHHPPSQQPIPSKYFTHTVGTGVLRNRFNEVVVQIDFEDPRVVIGTLKRAFWLLFLKEGIPQY